MHQLDSQRMNGGLRDEGGFTVVEALVATFILLAGLLSVVGVFDDSRDQNATGERSEIALMQAEQALEEMRGIPYNRLLLKTGAVDPGSNRVTDAGAGFQVKPDLSEQLVYYSSEGVPQVNAWVRPTDNVSIGAQDAPLNMTIHRFVTWRDEECSVVDLGALGSGLPSAIQATQGLVSGLVNLLSNLLGGILLNATNKLNLQALEARVENVMAKVNQIDDALEGVTQLDLCDIDLNVLQDVQKLGNLVPQLDALGPLLNTLNSLLGALFPNNSQIANQINAVNGQLNCMLQGGDNNYLNGILNGVDQLASDLGDTEKNTKRITVAVVVEPRKGVGPTKPVWASSVVRDPKAGILTSGGASC